MKLTFYGHACFGLEISGKNILIDPFITPNELAKNIDINQIPADYILLTHGHADHVADAEAIAKRTGAKLISNYEVVSWFQSKGIESVHHMNIGASAEFEFGSLQYVQAIHSSAMPDGSYGGSAGGFVITSPEACVYFAGDTALHHDMKLIGERHQLDLAILPIGDNFTMGVDDAVRCCDFIRCKKVVGMHFDTFPYIKINHEETKTKFLDAGIEFSIMEIGQAKEL
jgi:L-ascorbate metabolism protein UlaG (beta-lactamase superfamily)